jgi:DNA-binding transcriptional LysR family regulator
MNIENLKTYLEVVKVGCITRAADNLHLSQPSVTVQLRKLELELGCQLIEREKRKFTLTSEGKRFYKYADYAFQEHQHLLTDIARMREGINGHLYLRCTPIIAEFIMPSILNEFKKRNPSVDINVAIADSFKVTEEVDKGTDILGFCGILPERGGIESIKIGEDSHVLIVYSGHPFAQRKEINVADMIGETIIMAEPVAVRRTYKDTLANIGLDLEKYQPKVVMGTTAGVLSAVEAKIGIGLISNLAITNSQAIGLIKVIKVKHFKNKSDFYCIYRKERITSSITADFLDFIQEYSNSLAKHQNK